AGRRGGRGAHGQGRKRRSTDRIGSDPRQVLRNANAGRSAERRHYHRNTSHPQTRGYYGERPSGASRRRSGKSKQSVADRSDPLFGGSGRRAAETGSR